MYDGKKIIPGLIIFVGLVALPLWYNLVSGKTGYVPKPEIPADKKECVEPKAYIRVNHKNLLEDWKESVVRKGVRIYTASNRRPAARSWATRPIRCSSPCAAAPPARCPA